MRRLMFALWWVSSVCMAQDEAQTEQRLKVLSAELRCLVCQNQSLSDSSADLAVDLRNQVREQIKAGKTDEQIKDYLAQRYGDFVLYRPPVKSATLMLWVGPFLLLLLAGIAMTLYVRRRQRRTDDAPLTDAERARARSLLQDEDTSGERAP